MTLGHATCILQASEVESLSQCFAALQLQAFMHVGGGASVPRFSEVSEVSAAFFLGSNLGSKFSLQACGFGGGWGGGW